MHAGFHDRQPIGAPMSVTLRGLPDDTPPDFGDGPQPGRTVWYSAEQRAARAVEVEAFHAAVRALAESGGR